MINSNFHDQKLERNGNSEDEMLNENEIPVLSSSQAKSIFRKPRDFLENLSENQEKYNLEFLKNRNPYLISITQSRTQNEEPPISSNAINYALKEALVKKNNLSEENEQLRNDLSNLQTKLLLKENIYIETLNQISNYECEKNELFYKLQSMSKNNELMKSLLKLEEKEKMKHLEQSAIEKEELLNNINSLSNELDNLKKMFNNLSRENKNQRDEINKNKEIISNFENSNKNLLNEISNLKSSIARTKEENDKQISRLKVQYDQEKESLLMKIQATQGLINSSLKLEKKMKSNHEKEIREIKREISNKEKSKNKVSKNLENDSSSNSKINNDFKSKIFTNSKYTGNEAKSLFNYLLRSKSLNKNSFLEITGPKTNEECSKNERLVTPLKSKNSESVLGNLVKDLNEPERESIVTRDQNNILDRYSHVSNEITHNVNQDGKYSEELSNINKIIFNNERKLCELNRLSQNIKLKYNSCTDKDEQIRQMNELNDIQSEKTEINSNLNQMKMKQKEAIQKILK